MTHVEKATTPTLFLQGSNDERCPKCQSEELFASLMRAGDTPAELVLYPGEDHHFLGQGTPSVRQDAADRIIDWIARHVDQQTAPLAQDSEVQQQGG
jgi:dipeptidyl aminopeptidase/acylaminoacyl peptidase